MNLYSAIMLILSSINLIIIIVGWFVLYKQKKDSQKRSNKFELGFLRLKWEKEFIDQQVSLLYGPVSQLLKEQNIRFSRILEMLGRDKVFKRNQDKLSDLADDEQKIWVHFVNNYKIPIDNSIVEILRTNRHLIFEAEQNEYIINTFLDYAVGWELLDNQKRENVPNYYEYYYCFNFPKQFTSHINSTLKYLQKRQQELMDTMEE